MKKSFEKEGTFWWNVGVIFLLIGLLAMFTKDELQDLNEGFIFLSDILPNKAST